MYKEDLALNNLQWLICHKTKPNHIHLIYMYKEDLALNNLQWLICHKTQPNQTKPNTNNFQSDLFDPEMGSYYHSGSVDLGVMAMKWYSMLSIRFVPSYAGHPLARDMVYLNPC